MAWVVWARFTDEVPVQGWTSVMVVLLVTSGATSSRSGSSPSTSASRAKSAMGKPLYLVVSDPAEGPLGATRPPAPVARTSPEPRARRARRARGSVTRAARLGGRAAAGCSAATSRRRSTRGRAAQRLAPEGPIGWDDDGSGASDALESETDALPRRGAPRSARPWRLLWCAGRGGRRDVARGARAGDARCGRGSWTRWRTGCRDEPVLARHGHALLRVVGGRRLRREPGAAAVRRAVAGAAPSRRTATRSCAQEELVHARRRAVRGRSADRPPLEPLRPRAEACRSRRASSPTSAGRRCGASRSRSTSPSTPSATTCSPTDAGRMVGRGDGAAGGRRAGAAGRAGGDEDLRVGGRDDGGLGARRVAAVLRRPLRVALASSPAARLQPRVLSFRSRVWPEVRGQPTLLPLGVEAVRRDQLSRLMAAGLE